MQSRKKRMEKTWKLDTLACTKYFHVTASSASPSFLIRLVAGPDQNFKTLNPPLIHNRILYGDRGEYFYSRYTHGRNSSKT